MTGKPVSPEPRRHHYVPRLLLKGFAVERKRGKFQTQVFDKQTGRTFAASINDVMVEGDFNAIETSAGRVSFEAYVSEIESRAAPLIDRIVSTSSLAELNVADRMTLAAFAALQFVRGTAQRVMSVAAAEMLNKRLGVLDVDSVIEITPDDGKRFGLVSISKDLAEYASHFATKDLVLFQAPAGSDFMLGDNPVVLENLEPSDFFGNLGLSCLGIQIGLPISRRHQINFWCPSILTKAATSHDEVKGQIQAINAVATLSPGGLSREGKALLETAQRALSKVLPLLESQASGVALHLAPEHVVRANSLQVSHAERYVVSARGDFSLATEMIADNPGFRIGRRMRIN